VGRPKQAFDQSGLAGPSSEQDVAGDLPTGVPQRERDYDDVVERADDRDELRDQIGAEAVR